MPAPAPSLRGLVMVGTVVVTGLLAFLFWPDAPPAPVVGPPAEKVAKVAAVRPVLPARLDTGSHLAVPGPKLESVSTKAAGITPPDLKELTLTQRLDDFFLPNVALEKLPLGQALARLKQMLTVLDRDKALGLHRLIVTVPTSAQGRLVTLHSAGISYLEAVRTLATMAGCEAEVGEQRITLKTLPGPWPQLAERRSILDVLEGLFTPDGKPMSQNLDYVARLREDMQNLGLGVDDGDRVSLTVSQREALRRMTEERTRRENALIPPLTVYLLPEDHLPPIFQVSPAQVLELMMTLYAQGFPGFGIIPEALMDPTIAQQVLIIARAGETVSVSQYTTIPVARKAAVAEKGPSEPVMTWRWDESMLNTYGILILTESYHGGSSTTRGQIVSVGEGEDATLMETESSSSVMAREVTRAAETAGTADGRAADPGEGAATTVPVGP